MNSNNTRDKWDTIYGKANGVARPAAVLTDNLSLLPESGKALDLACGRGANAIALAEAGLDVEAWDISPVAIRELQRHAEAAALPINATACDITDTRLEPSAWDVIVISHYLDRRLTHAIRAALSPGGLLLYQTFTAAKVIKTGPSRPDFLLQEDELLQMFEGFEVIRYADESANADSTDPMAGRASIAARKPA